MAGEDAQRKFRTFSLTVEGRKDFTKVVDAFKNYCRPLKNETYERYKFFNSRQKPGESFDRFLTEVKMLASRCEFQNLEESLIRNRIVSGVLDTGLQERLLQQSKLTLKRAEEICRATEISHKQARDLQGAKEVDFIGKKKFVKPDNEFYDCLKCGMRHKKQSCPTYGKTCRLCSKPNHFTMGCKNKDYKYNNKSKHSISVGHTNKRNPVVRNYRTKQNIHEISNQAVNIDNCSDLPFIDMVRHIVDSNNNLNNSWSLRIVLNNKSVKFKLDTGASCNCLPLKNF